MITLQQAEEFLVLWFNVGAVVLALAAFGVPLVGLWVICTKRKMRERK